MEKYWIISDSVHMILSVKLRFHVQNAMISMWLAIFNQRYCMLKLHSKLLRLPLYPPISLMIGNLGDIVFVFVGKSSSLLSG